MDDIKKILKILEEHGIQLRKIENILTQTKPQIVKDSLKTTKNKKKKSVSDIIIDLVEQGFFDTPKAFGEIIEELKRQGYYYPRTSLTLPLQKLVRKRELGRISVSGKWAYVKR